MRAKTEFYIQDVLEDFGLVGEKRLVKDQLFFRLVKPALGNSTAPDTGFDGKATADHVRSYPSDYRSFKGKHPDFVLAWPELDVKVEAPVAAAEKVEEVKEEKAEKKGFFKSKKPKK